VLPILIFYNAQPSRGYIRQSVSGVNTLHPAPNSLLPIGLMETEI
jgi:hypothetical protein